MWRHLGILQRGASVWLGIGRGPAATVEGIVAQQHKATITLSGMDLDSLKASLSAARAV